MFPMSNRRRGFVSRGVAFPDGIANLRLRYRADQGVTTAGGTVSQWDDLSGNADHLLQSTAGERPSHSTTGSPAGDGSITFDGTDDGLGATGLAAIVQPLHFFIIAKQISWASGEVLINGTTSADYMIRGVTSTPQIGQNAGGGDTNLISPTLGSWAMVEALFNGASSHMALNDGAVVDAGNPGTGASQTVINICSEGDRTKDSNWEIAEIVLYSAAITGADRTSLKNYFNSRYSLW